MRLLRLEEAVPTLRMADVVEVMSMPLAVDFATQTDTHLVEKHIDRNYEWNGGCIISSVPPSFGSQFNTKI